MANYDERRGIYVADLDAKIDGKVENMLIDVLVDTGAEYGVRFELDSASMQVVYDLKAEFYRAMDALGLEVTARD